MPRQQAEDNITLGYSASVCDYNGHGETSSCYKSNRLSGFQRTDNAMANPGNFYCHSTLSANPSLFSKSSSYITTTNKEIALDCWYIQPMVGTLTIQVCGKKIDGGKKWKTGAITTRVNSRCILTGNNSLYRLVGPIVPAKTIPCWFEEKFSCGFPKSWKAEVAEYMNWLSKEESGGESDAEKPAKEHKSQNAAPVGQPPVKLELHQWAIQIFGNSIFVEGFARNNSGTLQLYKTGSIEKVLNKTLLSTTSGSCYRINGPISLEATVEGGVPLWLARKFNNGFPSNWKELLSSYLKYILSRDGSFQEISSHCKAPSFFSNYIPNKQHDSCNTSNRFSFSTNKRHSMDTSCLSTIVNVPNTLVKPKRKIKEKPIEVLKDRSINLISSTSKANSKQDAHKTIISGDFDVIPSKKPTKRASMKRKPNSYKKHKTPCVKKTANKKVTEQSTPLSKPKTTKATSLSEPSFCSPVAERGLYKTRSGRHVFPPLQNWTHQRLVSEQDENGNDVVIFVPGNKSVLNIASPVTEYLRTADWIHRQFEQDQLQNLPSPSLTLRNSVQKVTKHKKSVKTNCVKNLLNVTPTTDSMNGGQACTDIFSVSTHEKSINDFNTETVQVSSTVLDPIMNSPPSVSRVVQRLNECETGTSGETQVVSENSNIENFIRSTSETPEKVVVGHAPTKATSLERNEENGDQKLPQNKTITTETCSDFVSTNTLLPRIHTYEKTKSPFMPHISAAEKKKRKTTPKHQVCLENTPPSFRYNLRSKNVSTHHSSARVPLQTGISNVERKTRPSIAPVKRSLKRKRTEIKKAKKVSAIRTTTSSENVTTKDITASTIDSVASKRLRPRATSRRLDAEVEALIAIPTTNVNTSKTEIKKHAVNRTSKSAGRNKKIVKKQVLNDNVLIASGQTRTDAEAREKSLVPFTGGRGTVKLKKQIQATLIALNQAKNDQDFFEAEKSTLQNLQPKFSEELFQLDSQMNFITPYTPVSKLPTGFEEYVATPSWFKTPSGGDGFSCTDFNTPKAVKSSLPSLEPSTNATEKACKVVVQIQKEQKKKRKPTEKPERVIPLKIKRKRTISQSDMFHVEVEQDQYSDKDDDYFSE